MVDRRQNLFPDYQFLVLAGTKGQTSLSRQEFDRWARTYAQSLADQAYAMRMYQKAVQKFNKAKNQKAKLAMQESRRLIALEQTLTVEEVILLATALGDIIRRNVQDPDILREISREWRAIFNLGPNRPAIS